MYNQSHSEYISVGSGIDFIFENQLIFQKLSKSIDVTTLEVSRKFVRPIDQQGEHESRRLWQHVTNALKLNDITNATEHKKMVCIFSRDIVIVIIIEYID